MLKLEVGCIIKELTLDKHPNFYKVTHVATDGYNFTGKSHSMIISHTFNVNDYEIILSASEFKQLDLLELGDLFKDKHGNLLEVEGYCRIGDVAPMRVGGRWGYLSKGSVVHNPSTVTEVESYKPVPDDDAGFVKHDKEKPMLSLIEPNFILELGDALTIGARKYSKGNWKKCKDPQRYSDAALRHLYAWLGGEKIDAETGKNHLILAACNLMFLHWLDDANT